MGQIMAQKKGINHLTKKQIDGKNGPGYLGDGGGLWLREGKQGSKSWVFRFTINGKAREMGLGALHTISLAAARDTAAVLRKAVYEGRDPIEERKASQAQERKAAAKIMTFQESALAYIAAHETGWKNKKHAAQWGATLETYAFPIIGKLSVADIDIGLVMKVIEPIWQTKTETASRVRGRIESVLDWATVRGYRQGDNPARWKGCLDTLLPARNKVQKPEHHAAMPYVDVGDFMLSLKQKTGISPRALEFAILTAARSGEVRGATWEEIDFQAKTWTIPAERMKAGKEHIVPLSEAAIEILANLPRSEASPYIFPAPRGGQLSDMALTAVLKRMGKGDLTQHGFRSTFRDWAAETTAFPREVMEHALAHQLKDKAEAAYQRGALLVKRAQLMELWAKSCYTPKSAGADVIQLKRG